MRSFLIAITATALSYLLYDLTWECLVYIRNNLKSKSIESKKRNDQISIVVLSVPRKSVASDRMHYPRSSRCPLFRPSPLRPRPYRFQSGYILHRRHSSPQADDNHVGTARSGDHLL